MNTHPDMNILIVAIESGRWGPARLPRELARAGLSVAALCPAGNPLAASGSIAHHFDLPAGRSARRLAAALAEAIDAWRPRLIVPADEQVVALLHALVRRGPVTGGLGKAALALVTRSLGNPARFDAMLFKGETLALAQLVGLRAPRTGTVHSVPQAAEVAARIGYPVYAKAGFGWAGQGVTRCADARSLEATIAATLPATRGRLAPMKSLVRRCLSRDWFPVGIPFDVQQAIDGHPAMYCAVAMEGRMLAGFAGFNRTGHGTGPSTHVSIGAHAEMERAARVMIAALGATGFIGFDFMIEHATGDAYLLECNPRPIQIGHLGRRIGVDLAAALAAALAGDLPAEPQSASGEADIALFPQSWLQDPESLAGNADADVPWDDPGLMRCMVAAAPAGSAIALHA